MGERRSGIEFIKVFRAKIREGKVWEIEAPNSWIILFLPISLDPRQSNWMTGGPCLLYVLSSEVSKISGLELGKGFSGGFDDRQPLPGRAVVLSISLTAANLCSK